MNHVMNLLTGIEFPLVTRIQESSHTGQTFELSVAQGQCRSINTALVC